MVHASLALFVVLLAAGTQPDAAPEFSHQKHLSFGLVCTSCHDSSPATGAPVLRSEAACSKCHQDGPPEHAPLPKQRALDAIFPHRAHALKLACEACHTEIATDKISTGPVLTNETCTSCHAQQEVSISATACARCHGEDRKTIRPANHGPNWRMTHGAEAAWRVADSDHGLDCRQCHSKSSCRECHDQMAPQNHTGLWRMQAHGIAAEWDRDSCKTCHETATCVRCHQTTEPTNHAGPWLQLHGLVAGSRVSESCSACHQPQWCATCHAQSVRP